MSLDPPPELTPRGPTDFRAPDAPDVSLARPPASGAKRLAILVALVAGVPAAAAAAFYLADAGKGWVWIAGLVVGGVAGPLWLLVSALRLVTAIGRRDLFALRYRRPRFAVPAVVTCLAAAWALVGGLYQRTSVYVDNWCGQDVALELDGQPWTKAANQATPEMRVLRGSHTVVVHSADGRQLDKQTVTVDAWGPYIFNVLGAQSYVHGVAHYVVGQSPPDTITPITRQVWIKANVDYLFEDAPKELSIEGSSEDRTYLMRGVPEGNQPNDDPK